MKDILERIEDSSHNESSHELICRLRDCADEIQRLRAANVTEPPFQARVQPWMLACFGADIAADKNERNHRFFEEAGELVQAGGMSREEAHALVDYTWSRPIGESFQEVGGVMVTLAALCLAAGLDMHAAGETELARITEPAIMERIRAKQAAKPKHSPLPAALPVIGVTEHETIPKWIYDQLCGTLAPAWEYIQTHQEQFGALLGDDKNKILVDEFLKHAASPAHIESAAPVDMVLFCPRCGVQHIDGAEWADDPHDIEQGQMRVWENPPHRSHLCHHCDFIWRPADVPTNGVASVKTRGKNDSPSPSSPPVSGPDERAAFEMALKETYQMVDPFNPPPAGSYARGSHEGIIAALKTIRENFERAAAIQTPTGQQALSDVAINIDGDLKATDGPLLELDALLANLHQDVWEAASQSLCAYDEAGKDEAKAIQKLVRTMIEAERARSIAQQAVALTDDQLRTLYNLACLVRPVKNFIEEARALSHALSRAGSTAHGVAEEDPRPRDCSGDPTSCPDNEGCGCWCSDRANSKEGGSDA